MSGVRAAIFDLDGTLVDTYAAHLDSWIRISQEIGHELTEAQFAHQFGRTNEPIIEELFEFAGAARPTSARVAQLAAQKEADFRANVIDDFPEMPGATSLLRDLHAAGWRLAGGTSAPQANADLFRAKLACGSLFETIVTGDDVVHGKPDPEVFVLAAARLGVSPARCIVIEDAPSGVEAARRAGMISIGFSSRGRTPASLAQADLVVGDLSQLTPQVMEDLLH